MRHLEQEQWSRSDIASPLSETGATDYLRVRFQMYRIEPDTERPGQWQIRNLQTDIVIAVGMHRDTAIQQVWMLENA